MAADKKIRKDKEIVLELEGQIKDIRQLLFEQLRCLDQHLDYHVGMLQDLQEYYRRHSEAEMEFSKGLDKLAKQLCVRQKKDSSVTGYSTHGTWLLLMESMRQQSRNHGFLGDIFHPVVVYKLTDIQEDIQRIHKKCREMVTSHHDELFKVFTELENSMKTYHTYHGNSQQAENKLLRVQSQKVKVDQQNAISKRFINYDKREEQKQAKYTEHKLKAMKARNEYLLSIDSANASLKKYFTEDFPKLVEKMDFGYHASLSQVVDIHIKSSCCLMNSDQERLNAMMTQREDVLAINDNACFRGQNLKLFSKPDDFEFQPHKGDEICHISAQDDTASRTASIKARIDSNTQETEKTLKELQGLEKDLLDKINYQDLDVVQIYRDEKPGVRSPTDREKRREERLKIEDAYLQKLHHYMKVDSLATRLNSKYVALRKVVGDGNYETVHLGARSEPVRKRPGPSLLPKPHKCVKNSNVSQAKLFGGTIEDYVEATGTQIPNVIRSCIRSLNLYGLHHQGIFRVPGSQNEINNFKQQFEKGIDPLTTKIEGDEINSVAGLLKLYFRELKEPLFAPDKFAALISITEKFTGNEEESKSSLFAVMASLPRPRMIVLRYLFAFLNHLSEFSDENMMDARNIAVCFGPTLLPTPVTSDISNHIYVNRLVELIITHQEELFPKDNDIVYEKCLVEGEKDFLDSVSDDDVLNSNLLDEDDDYEECEAIAEHDYHAQTNKELSFKRGDVMTIIYRASEHWWFGECMGLKGMIPDKYIQIPKREKLTNLKKGCALTKSSECLLSPEEVSFSSSHSSLDRSISQPNVAIPVPRLDISESDPFPNVAQTPDSRETENNGNALFSVDSALTRVNMSLGFIEKVDQGKRFESKASTELPCPVSGLDVPIPVSQKSPSPVGSSEYNATRVKVMLPTGVRKSTSFRDPSPSRHPDIVAAKNSNFESNVDAVNSDSGDKRNSKSSTLPRSVVPGMAGFDSDLLEEINTFSSLPRSSPVVEVQKKAAPPARPKPPTRKPDDSNKTASPSNTAVAPGSVKAGPPTISTPLMETTSKK